MKTTWIALLSVLLLAIFAVAGSYTVQPGDTLSTIARRELGQSARWQEIAELNNLKEPHRLKIGQQLEMPSDYQSPGTQPTSTQKGETASIFKNLLAFFSILSIPIAIIIALGLLMSVFSCWLFALGYKRACRIFDIESTLKKCFLASVCLTGIGIVLNVVLPYADTPRPPNAHFVTYAGISLLSLFLCITFLKFFFNCNWLQSIGVYIIGGLIGALWHCLVALVISLPLGIYFLTTQSGMS